MKNTIEKYNISHLQCKLLGGALDSLLVLETVGVWAILKGILHNERG